MARSSNQKLKLLYIAKILTERTDENHIMSAQDIIETLSIYDISVERKTIYTDIELLKSFGLDIEHVRGKNGGYYIASRNFALPELKLLVDAVQSSRFITNNKSFELIKKLSLLTSKAQAKQLNRQVYIAGRAKTFNESVYYTIDTIHAAINERKKISFRYFSYSIDKKQVYRKHGERYIQTPVAMCWSDDNYYLIAYNAKYNSLTHYRVDRMNSAIALDEPSDEYDYNSFNAAEYSKRVFGMYNGNTVKARLAFHESLVSVVLDHFGGDTHLTDIGNNRFCIDAAVSESPVFLGWMFQLGEKAEIFAPESLREAMRDWLNSAVKIYTDL